MSVNPVNKQFTFDDIDEAEDYYMGTNPEFFGERYVAWYEKNIDGRWVGIEPNNATMKKAREAFLVYVREYAKLHPDSDIIST